MPKVLILSDSHGLKEEICHIKERHQVDRKIHCGDSELDIDAPELAGFVKVAGNCDFDRRYSNEEAFSLGDANFYITHGHLHQVKSNLLTLSYRAEEKNANVICFGHTHIAGAEKIDKKLFINPGSIRLSKGRVAETYAIMEWKTISDVQITFYTTTGKIVDALFYKTSLDGG